MITQMNHKQTPKREAREIAGDQVEIDLSSHLIGCESGASFLNQSNSEGKQNHCNPNTIETRSI